MNCLYNSEIIFYLCEIKFTFMKRTNNSNDIKKAQKLTANQFLKLHPERYVMLTFEFGAPVYVAPLKDLSIQVTPDITAAETWSALDVTPLKLNYHKASTGFKNLEFKQITK